MTAGEAELSDGLEIAIGQALQSERCVRALSVAGVPSVRDLLSRVIWNFLVLSQSNGVSIGDIEGSKAATLPLTVDGCSMLVTLVRGLDGCIRCVSVLPVDGGQFVHGADNAIYGQWDALLAATPSGKWTVVPGHAGEIIPGRLDDHVERLRAIARGEPRGPVQIDFDVSMACPSACSFCFSAPYRSTRQSGRLMDGQLMLTLIRKWADEQVRVVRFDGGGDPLTHPQLPAAISLCAKKGIRTAILTAGDLLLESLLSPLIDARTYLRISLNAATDDTRWQLHGQRNIRSPITSIVGVVRELVRRREAEFGSDAACVMPLGATSMIHPDNAGETADIAKLARDAGFDHISFRVILGADHKVNFSREQLDVLQAQFTEIRHTIASADFQVFLPTRDLTDTGYIPSDFFKKCRTATHRAVVEVGSQPSRAAVVPCGRYRGEGYRAEDPHRPRVMFGELDASTTITDLHAQPHSGRLLATFPAACGDCIDRSANVMLERIAEQLNDDPSTQFHPFRTLGATEGYGHA
ncbi:radical SAM protein [Streptomyces sp. NPDC060085]|uniref:radical SAM protein n=1 Tax=Streptomyces sp. NPDC060085 TaxID=3347054 RepID=UPI0036697D47